MIVQVVQAVLVLPMRLLLEAIIIFWPSFRRSKKIRLGTVVEHFLHISLEIKIIYDKVSYKLDA